MRWPTLSRSGRGRRLNWRIWFGEPWGTDVFSIKLDAGLTGNFRHLDLKFAFGGEDTDFRLDVGLWWFSLYLSLCGVFSWDTRRAVHDWTKRRVEELNKTPGRRVWAYALDPFDGRSTGVAIHHRTLWFEFWRGSSGTTFSDTPTIKYSRKKGLRWWQRWSWQRGVLPWNAEGGWQWSIDLEKLFLLGDTTYEKKPVDKLVSWVAMPEGDYPAMCEVLKVRWRRNGPLGWLFRLGRRWQYRVQVDVPGGIPHPGKGTAAHNCGEDGLFGTSFAVTDEFVEPSFFLRQMAMNVLKTRQQRGGIRWTPNDGWPEHCRRPKRAV